MLKCSLIVLALVSCGDNQMPPDSREPSRDPDIDIGPIDPGLGCADFDINVVCPDASVVVEPDASVPPLELDEETKAACCHALLDGSPPNHECGYPPGLCKNGKKDMFCRTATGEDAKFTLCNP